MARITPSDGTLVKLEDYTPYQALLTAAQIVDGSEAYPVKRLEVTWQLANGDPDDTIKDWCSLKLGQVPGGDVAKLRQLLNAIAGKPETTKVAWFDDATLEWGYDAKLTVGLPVTFRGKNKPKQSDPTQLRYRIEAYQPASASAAAPPPPPGPSAQPGFLRVSADSKYGWTGSAWVEIPAAPAPPPPPAPAAASNGRRPAAPAPVPAAPAGGIDEMDQIPF